MKIQKKKKVQFAVFRVGECRDRVLYNDVQNVVVMNTSASEILNVCSRLTCCMFSPVWDYYLQ